MGDLKVVVNATEKDLELGWLRKRAAAGARVEV
jgi:hypothetical protein